MFDEATADWSKFRIITDTPSIAPTEEFQRYAAAFADVIHYSRPQFAIGIFGGWGSGKTTLLKTIDAGLDRREVVSVEFSAWRYEKEEYLIVPLLDTIREAVSSAADQDHQPAQQTFREHASRFARTLGRIALAIGSSSKLKLGIADNFTVELDGEKAFKSYQSQRQNGGKEETVYRSIYHWAFSGLRAAFEDFHGETGRRIVVFVDDLDRCLPTGALSVLESVKLFFDFPGIVFVLGLDRSVVEWCVDQRYLLEHRETADEAEIREQEALYEEDQRRVSGAQYVKKIFQVPFNLRRQNIASLPDYMASINSELTRTFEDFDDSQREFIASRAKNHLCFIDSSGGFNPREVKRFLNEITFLMKVRPDKSYALDTFLGLTTLQFQPSWRNIQQALTSRRQLFLDAVRSVVSDGGADALSTLRQLAPTVPDLPTAFREYVWDGRSLPSGEHIDPPGRALLETPNIDQYLTFAESTGTVQSSGTLRLIRVLAAISDQCQIAIRDRSTTPVGDAMSALSELSAVTKGDDEQPIDLPRAIMVRLHAAQSDIQADLHRASNLEQARVMEGGLEDALQPVLDRVRDLTTLVMY